MGKKRVDWDSLCWGKKKKRKDVWKQLSMTVTAEGKEACPARHTTALDPAPKEAGGLHCSSAATILKKNLHAQGTRTTCTWPPELWGPTNTYY